MRNWARIGILAAALLGSAGLTGCHHIEYHFGNAHFAAAEPQVAERPARKSYRKASLLRRIAKPRGEISPGARIRQFCGQRHIRFQRGQLHESPAEKARNNELCRQEYKG